MRIVTLEGSTTTSFPSLERRAKRQGQAVKTMCGINLRYQGIRVDRQKSDPRQTCHLDFAFETGSTNRSDPRAVCHRLDSGLESLSIRDFQFVHPKHFLLPFLTHLGLWCPSRTCAEDSTCLRIFHLMKSMKPPVLLLFIVAYPLNELHCLATTTSSDTPLPLNPLKHQIQS